jgi:hypothetical protein
MLSGLINHAGIWSCSWGSRHYWCERMLMNSYWVLGTMICNITRLFELSLHTSSKQYCINRDSGLHNENCQFFLPCEARQGYKPWLMVETPAYSVQVCRYVDVHQALKVHDGVRDPSTHLLSAASLESPEPQPSQIHLAAHRVPKPASFSIDSGTTKLWYPSIHS